MKNIKLTLAYEGTSYLGWQDSKEGATIEGELKKVLSQILQCPITLQAASRTDARVHAEGQVVNFLIERKEFNLKRIHMSLNQMLPPSIRIWELEEAALTFHPSLDAKGKEYLYRLTPAPIQLPFDRHFAWHLYTPINWDKVKQAARHFIGRHDFSSFCNASVSGFKDPYCTLHRLDVSSEGKETAHIEIIGDRFLYKMVRNLVGTLVDVGRGKLTANDAEKLLKAKDRTQGSVTAPAHGLCLKKVYY